MTLDEETITEFLAEIARQGCSSWETRRHRIHLDELARWLQDPHVWQSGGQDAKVAFLWWGQSLSYPDWSVIESRYATLEALSRWLREGRVVERSGWTLQNELNTKEAYENTTL